MCGIFGYVGTKDSNKDKKNPVSICLEGLKSLEYRGYDSAGIAGVFDGKLLSCKSAGKIQSLLDAVLSNDLKLDIAIAHTRWATHGKPTDLNAHPHLDQDDSVAIVHNGIIENHDTLRDMLIDKGFTFQSDTDSEVIAQLISHYYTGSIREAVLKAINILQGSLAIAVIHKDHPNEILAAAKESPLAIGEKNGEYFLSSDPNSFKEESLNVFYLQEGEVAILKQGGVETYNSLGDPITKLKELASFSKTRVTKNGYEHFMLKEIFEQPETIQHTLHNRLKEDFGTAVFDTISISPHELQSANRILLLACGTSWHAACIGATMLESIARIPTEAHIASEFRYTNPIISENTLVIAISQSGETADTIAAVREAKAKGSKVISICNVKNSTLARESDSTLFLRAGPEVSVCSTKTFTSHLTALALFTLYMARLRHMGKEDGKVFIQGLKELPTKVDRILSQEKIIAKFAKKYARFDNFFFLGRQYMFPTSLEAALKLKEISYLSAMAYPAGEMKHGPIALVNPDLAVVGLCGNAKTQDKMISNLMEVKARGGTILAFAPKGYEPIKTITDDIIWLPKACDELSSILYSVATQLFAYHIAKLRGTDIDQPRNLAKSVTVE